VANAIPIKHLGRSLEYVLGKIDKNTIMKSEKAVRATFIATAQEIIVRTPVDTGRARANWFVTKSTPSSEVTSSTNGNYAKAEARTAFKDNVLGETFYISNNLPYIGVLEFGGYPKSVKKGSRNRKGKRKGRYSKRSKNGFSKKAPNGMVRIALSKFDDRLKKSLKRYIK
tara:strand:- start:644 stop:1153 length:510 start_codon:yes stop_codon:yes gene_type:complete